MADVLFEESALVLTGIFITFISSFLYTINAQGFIARGKYRKKEEAILIFLGATIFLGLVTPVIHEISKLTIQEVPIPSIFGILLLGTNFVLHTSIPSWKQTSTKSLLIYLFGTFFVVLGFLIGYYLS
jgi:heme/copper-type cytochrome/quinol oxidase subunit 3